MTKKITFHSIAKTQPQLGLEGGGEQFEIVSPIDDSWFEGNGTPII